MADKAKSSGKRAKRGDRLADYREKRAAERTPEPVPSESSLGADTQTTRASPREPSEGPLPEGDDDTFVIQEHHARSLHWDLRLERDGVLVSWAVPKGIPGHPKTDHLAVHTEDHPLEYASFEGEIPKGEYGAGQMMIWDRGTYETEKWSEREVKIVLHGSRVSGRYVLFRTGGKNWMIHRMDPPADPDAAPMPDAVRPMLPEEGGRLPRDRKSHAYEFAWGGRRLLAYVEGGRTRFSDERGRAVGGPAGLGSRLGQALGARPAVLDGELARVEGRETYLLFDLLYLDGRLLLDAPYEERRELLDGLELNGARWQTAPWYPGEADAVREAARAQGLPGIVAKRLDSPYEPGTTSGAWRHLEL